MAKYTKAIYQEHRFGILTLISQKYNLKSWTCDVMDLIHTFKSFLCVIRQTMQNFWRIIKIEIWKFAYKITKCPCVEMVCFACAHYSLPIHFYLLITCIRYCFHLDAVATVIQYTTRWLVSKWNVCLPQNVACKRDIVWKIIWFALLLSVWLKPQTELIQCAHSPTKYETVHLEPSHSVFLAYIFML